MAHRADRRAHELGYAALHRRALRVRESVEHVPPRADEGARVARFDSCSDCPARLGECESRVDGNEGGLVGIEDPVPILLRQILPRYVDVVAERDEHVPQLVAVPGGRPRCDGALPDGE